MCKEIWKLQIRINFRDKRKESDALAIACFMFVLLSLAASVLVSMCCLVPLQVVCSYVYVFLCVLQVVCCGLCVVCVCSCLVIYLSEEEHMICYVQKQTCIASMVPS